MSDELLLTVEEMIPIVYYCLYTEIYDKREVEIARTCGALVADRISKAQLAKVKQHLQLALEQSRKGEPIDLPEEWFELFSAIQNDGISKAYKQKDRPDLAKRRLKMGLLTEITNLIENNADKWAEYYYTDKKPSEMITRSELSKLILAKMREVAKGEYNPFSEPECKEDGDRYHGFETARQAILKAMEVDKNE